MICYESLNRTPQCNGVDISGRPLGPSGSPQNKLDYKCFLDTAFADASEQITGEKTFEFESKQH